MRRDRPFWTSIPFALLLASAANAYPSVLVVDRTGAGDFTEIQDAVLAAQDGDTILVRVPSGGTGFQAVDIVDKALTIASDSASQLAIVRKVRVRNLAAGKTVVLTRLSVNPLGTGIPPGDPSIWLDHNAGSVRLVSCASKGGTWFASAGLGVESSPGAVAFADCDIEGGHGSDGDEDNGGPGGPGLTLIDGIAAAYDSEITGGHGGDLYIGWFPGSGGPGVEVEELQAPAHFLAQQLLVRGGEGGADFDCFELPNVGAGGGTGFVQSAGATTALIDTLIVGGAGGHASCGPDGPPGAEASDSGTTLMFPGPHVSLAAPTVGREGEIVVLRFAGTPGDRVFLLAGREPTFVEGFGGALLVLPEPGSLGGATRIPLGRIDVDGQLDVLLTLPQVPSAPGARNLWLQALAEHADSTRTLGTFAVITVLDSIY